MKKTVCGITAVCLFLAAAPVQADGGNPLAVRQTVDYILRDSAVLKPFQRCQAPFSHG